jgi:hypothetical protein
MRWDALTFQRCCGLLRWRSAPDRVRAYESRGKSLFSWEEGRRSVAGVAAL